MITTPVRTNLAFVTSPDEAVTGPAQAAQKPEEVIEYLQWRYKKVLGYHNDPSNTPEEIRDFALELDQISERIKELVNS